MAKLRTIESGPLYRSVTIRKESIIDEEKRTVRMSFSSEEPVERFFGSEILDHKKKSIRTGRFKSGSANLLMDHDPRDVVGVIESVEVDSQARKGFVTVRFGKSERATEIWNDVMDGIRTSVSVGYRVHKAIIEEQNADGPDVFRITDWEPFEVSLVSVPADASVGVGRSDPEKNTITIEGRSQMHKCNLCKREVGTEDGVPSINEHGRCPECEAAIRAQVPAAVPVISAAAVTVVDDGPSVADMRKAELARMKELRAMGEEFKSLEGIDDLVREGMDDTEKGADWLRHGILDKMKKPGLINSSDLGLKPEEKRKYSFRKAILASADANYKDGGFEREVSDAVAKELRNEPQGLFMPYDLFMPEKRDQNVGTDSAGGYLVETIHDAAGFIELLRNKSLIMAMGARALPGLVGDYTAPKQTAGATFYWVTEGGTTTESQLTVGQISMTPKTVSARVDMTRRALLQTTPAVEQLVRDDLLRGIAIEMDRVSINGASANDEPVGILNTTGIGSVIGGSNGAAMTWGKVVDLETEVAVDNADVGALGYMTNTRVRGSMKQIEKSANTAQFLWPDGRLAADGFGEVNGYRAGVTNQIPNNLTKGTSIGVASAMIFGNYSDWLIGMWGAMDLFAEKVTLGDSGGLVVRIFQDMDTAARHAESFSAMEDILTS